MDSSSERKSFEHCFVCGTLEPHDCDDKRESSPEAEVVKLKPQNAEKANCLSCNKTAFVGWYCQSCGKPNPSEEQRFCSHCGKMILTTDLACPYCKYDFPSIVLKESDLKSVIVVGKGGFGTVVKCLCNGENVVAKIGTFDADEIVKEVSVMQKLTHDYVVPWRGVVLPSDPLNDDEGERKTKMVIDGDWYKKPKVVMKLLAGNLADRVESKQNNDSLLKRLVWLFQVAQGMRFVLNHLYFKNSQK